MNAQIWSVQRWTRNHSFVVFTAFVVAIVLKTAVPLAVIGFLSFAYFIATHPNIESEGRVFSFWQMPPNWVTLLRVILITVVGLTFQFLTPLALGLLGLIILVSDKLDGYLAESQQMNSFFGAQFDQETDAFFISIYALLLYLDNYAGSWVLALGLLRYLNIIALVLLRQQHKKEPRFLAARLVATMVMIALLIPFVTPMWLYTPYVALSVVFLCLSFAYTFSAHVMQPE